MACRNTDGCDGVRIMVMIYGKSKISILYKKGGQNSVNIFTNDYDRLVFLPHNLYNDFKVTWGGGNCKLHSRWMSVFERSTATGYKSIQVSYQLLMLLTTYVVMMEHCHRI